MRKYGLISETDVRTLEDLLLTIRSEYPGTIRTCEVGVFDGDTSRGIHQFFLDHGWDNHHIAIDSERYFKIPPPFEGCELILGESMLVNFQVPDNSQHLVFIDANHSFPTTIVDFFSYAPKVIPGGVLAFHDTGAHIAPFTDYQDMGDRKDPNMYISCRKALREIGLLNNGYPGWMLIADAADASNPAGGITAFRKA